MNFSGKVAFLRDLIVNTLTPLISDSYVLWDLPYYTNIGDILIWEGTENFLKQLSSQCISKCSYQTFSYKPYPRIQQFYCKVVGILEICGVYIKSLD